MNPLVRAKRAIPAPQHDGVRLAPIDFEAGAASISCLVGPDPAAATSYLRMLAAIELPLQGRLELLGSRIEGLNRHTWQDLRKHVGYVAGDTPLLSVQTGLLNVMLPANYHRIASPNEIEQRALKLLERLGCGSDVSVLPAFMSILERHLVSLARALILDPKVLFLEYPFQELGTDERKSMELALDDLRVRDRLCIVAAVNNLPFVRKYADQILFVSESSTARYGSWGGLASAADPEVLSYLEDEGGY